VRQELLELLPQLTRFTYGAINPLTVEDYTIGELSAYVAAERKWRETQPSPSPTTF
jgi:hypothetical protein